MAAITITDLPANRDLERKALSAIRGGGAPWVFGWIRPFLPAQPSFGPPVNFFQVINSYHADQMNIQLQVVDIVNSAAHSNINVLLNELGTNTKAH